MSAGYIRLPQTNPQDDDNRSSHGEDTSVCGTAVDNELRLVAAEQDAHAGVKKVEAAQRVYGRYSRWCLFVGCVLSPPWKRLLSCTSHSTSIVD